MQGLVIMTFNLRRKRQKMHGNFELKEFIIWIFPLPHLSLSLSLSLLFPGGGESVLLHYQRRNPRFLFTAEVAVLMVFWDFL